MDNNISCCDFLLNQICFFPNEICPCCSKTIENTVLRPNIIISDESSFNLNEFYEIRKKYIEEFISGKMPYCYNNCTLYEECVKKSSSFDINDLPFRYMVISNRTYCNCDCIYCEQTHNSTRNIINQFKPYDIIPILQELHNRNLIAKKCKFIISGGELAEYPKFELKYIFELSKKLNGSLLLLSSGIKYSELIEDVLMHHNAFLTVSIDSGTEEIYNRIKRVNKFNQVWENMQRYIEASKFNKNGNVELKYIVIPGINDSVEEAKAFIDRCLDINCSYIKTEIEHFYMNENYDSPLPDSVKDVFSYFFKITKEKNLKLMVEGVGRPWIMRKLNERT